MITLADIFALPAFETHELLTPVPEAGSRVVRGVGILDGPPDEANYDDYVPGELIITNLQFARGDEDMIERALVLLLERGVSAVAVRDSYSPAIPEKALQTSVRCGVPLYLYHGQFHEVVAYQVLDLLRRDELQADKSRLVNELLVDHDESLVRDRLYDLGKLTGSSFQCAALMQGRGDDASLYALMELVKQEAAAFKQKWENVVEASVCRYQSMVLVLVSYAMPVARTLERPQDDLVERLLSTGVSHIGLGEEGLLSDGDLGIREALAAVRTAHAESERVVSWADLRYDAFRAVATGSRMYKRVAAHHQIMLANYDQEHDSELFETCLAVARAFGDIKEAAEHLHIHPNTIRYRLGKAKDVMGMAGYTDREFMSFLGLVFLKDTNFYLDRPSALPFTGAFDGVRLG